MRRTTIVLLSVAVVMIAAIPAISEGWGKDDRPYQGARGRSSFADIKSGISSADEPALASVMFASEKLLSEMPADSYLIQPGMAWRLMRERAVVILDVRERGAFEAARIPRAVNIPLRVLSSALALLPPDRSATILVYCRNGDRGAMSLTLLRLWGYTNAFSIVDGMNGWIAAGLPLEQPDPIWHAPERFVARPR